MKTYTFHINNMKCEGCSSKIIQALSAIPGVESVSTSISDESVQVQCQENIEKKMLSQALNELGYPVKNLLFGLF